MQRLQKKPIDPLFLGICIALVAIGVIMFVSASLGILAKNETKFYGVLFNHLLLGLVGGGVAFFLTAYVIPYTFWRKYAFYLFLISLGLMLLVFVPGVGFSHGGARRWVVILGTSFQPAEFLKLGFILYFAAWLSWVKQKVTDIRFGVLPLVVLLGIAATLLFLQPDTKSFILILITASLMLFVSGLPIKYFMAILLLGVLTLGTLALTTPYLQSRIRTFINPTHDQSGSSYQLKQALLAIGSGQLTGRGLGQSVQKFSFLPEPQGDSIFAVVGEELGFIGGTIILLLYLSFALRGLRIASHSPNQFARLLSLGIVLIITFQSFLNIASIIGVFPLTGVPLVFMSQGGTSLLLSLAAVGIVCNISRYQKI